MLYISTQPPCKRPQSSESQEVECRADEVGMQLNAAHERAAQSAIGFHPAEDLFNAFALALAHRVAGVARGAPIQTRRVATFDQRRGKRSCGHAGARRNPCCRSPCPSALGRTRL